MDTTFALQNEISGTPGFDQIWTERQAEMQADADLKLLSDLRLTGVRSSSLAATSSMFIGLYKYGKPIAGFANLPVDPLMESIDALAYNKMTVDVGHVAAKLDRGHILRVDVSAAYFPLFDRNPNTGGGPFRPETRIASQKLFHEPGSASRILLHLIPATTASQ
jgi:hypothetical protein